MQLSNLLRDDDAVSPVIGVILMVAITVILAAVIGAFVLNLGGGQNAGPSASFSVQGNGSDALVEHRGGDAIDLDDVEFTANGTTYTVGGSPAATHTGSGDWSSGETVVLPGEDGSSVDVIWLNPDSDDSTIIGEGTAE